MAETRYTLEGGTAGQTVTGFTAQESTVKYDATHPAHGTMGAAVLAPGTATGLARHALANEAKVEIVFYVWLTTAPSTHDLHLLRATYTGDVTSAIGMVTSTGFARLTTTGSGAATTRWTAGSAFPTGQIVRVGIYVEAGTSATTGKARMAYFLGDSTTPVLDSGLISSIDTAGTAAALINARVGKLSGGTASYTGDLHFDDVLIRTGADADGLFDPVTNVPPTASAGANQNVAASATVNLTGTSSDTDGTIASHAWTFTYPTSGAPSLTGGTTATPSFTAGSAGALYILQYVVTDNGGATSTPSLVEIRVPDSGEVLPIPAAATGGFTRVGGSSSDGAAVNDASDSTYLESASLGPTAQTMRIRAEPSTARSAVSVTARLALDVAGASVVKLRLVEGSPGTIRAEWTDLTVTATPTDFTRALTAPQIASITDWGALRFEVEATA